jgi:hypothetical protein
MGAPAVRANAVPTAATNTVKDRILRKFIAPSLFSEPIGGGHESRSSSHFGGSLNCTKAFVHHRSRR